jgi:hypothetical protein
MKYDVADDVNQFYVRYKLVNDMPVDDVDNLHVNELHL